MESKTKYYIKIFSKIAILAAIALGIFVTYKVAIFYMPFIIALIIASIAEPIIKFLTNKFKIKRNLASIISLVFILAIIGIILTLIISNLVEESIKLIDNAGVYAKDLYQFGIGIINDIQEGKIQIADNVKEILENSLSGFIEWLQEFITNLFTGLLNTIGSIPTWFTYGFITILAVVFICFDREYIINSFKKQIPTEWLEKIKKVFKISCEVSINYIKAEAKLSFICFVLVLIGLLGMKIFGINMEYPIIMAILIGFVDVLPLFGAGTVMIPWAIYLLITGQTPTAIGVAIIWIIWAIIKNILEPKFVSNQMGIHPIFTLIAMYTGFRIIGVLGLIIGPIILLILKNIFGELIEKGILRTLFEKNESES